MRSHDLAAHYQAIPTALRATLTGENYLLPEFEEDDDASLKGFRAALVATHGPELIEFHVPVTYLRERGAAVDVLAPDWMFDGPDADAAGLVVLAQWLATDVCVKADKRLSAAAAADYDLVIVPGGAWNPIMLRTDTSVQAFLGAAHERKVLIAAICHGPQVLIGSNTFPAGTKATGVRDIRVDLVNAGFVVEDALVVYDDVECLITCANPSTEALKKFCEEIRRQARRVLMESL
jgi:deglycase